MTAPTKRAPGRWVIACINWIYPDAPHAALWRVGADGYFDWDGYYATFADAVAAADRYARRRLTVMEDK